MLTQRPEALQNADPMPNLSIRAASTSHGLDPLELVAVLTLEHVSDVDDTAIGPGEAQYQSVACKTATRTNGAMYSTLNKPLLLRNKFREYPEDELLRTPLGRSSANTPSTHSGE